MMKTIWKKASILMMILSASVIVVGCTTTTDTTTTSGTEVVKAIDPTLTDPDAIFYQGDGFSVTYGEIYEQFKINDGMTQLLYMVDFDLFTDYMDDVTQVEIDDKIKVLTYGSSDNEYIAELGDKKAELEADYDQTLYLLGHTDDEQDYVRLVVAKENYTREAMVDSANADQSWYIGDDAVAEYYTSSYFSDMTTIKIRFLTQEDAIKVMRNFNGGVTPLVTVNNQLRLYTGSTPINLVPSFGFDDTNTRVLTNEELLLFFIQMYNFVYQEYRTPIAENATVADLKQNPDLQVSYDTLYEANTQLATLVYQTLSGYEEYITGEGDLCYTVAPSYLPGKFDSSYYLVLNINEFEKIDLTDYEATVDGSLANIITANLYADLVAEMIEANLSTTSFVNNRVGEFRASHGFEIYDQYLCLDYRSIYAVFDPETEGHASIVASYDDVDITADQLLTFAMNLNGALYALYASQLNALMDLYFQEVYCDGDVTCTFESALTDSILFTEHEEALATVKSDFEASYWSVYYKYAEFLYVAYGAKSETDMIQNYYLKSRLQPYLIFDRLKANDWAMLTNYLMDQLQTNYDNYFSLDVLSLTIYLDRDENGAADDYQDFVADLEDAGAYATLIANFQTAIRNYLAASDTNTFLTLIRDYNKASRTEGTWAPFKQFGLCLKRSSFSDEESIDYATAVATYEEAIVNGLIAAYAEYQLETNIDKTSLYYSGVVETAEGISIFQCEKGDNFTKPTAHFEMTYTGHEPNYSLGSENSGDFPTLEQVKLYCEYRFYQLVFDDVSDETEHTYGVEIPDLPTSFITTMETYFLDIVDGVYVIGVLNGAIADIMNTGTFVNAVPAYCSFDDATLKIALLRIQNYYYHDVFEGYTDIDE
ncbi:MAG: hypothetical protein WC479_05400 [Candidatus Izemoplasmatales bacterium]